MAAVIVAVAVATKTLIPKMNQQICMVSVVGETPLPRRVRQWRHLLRHQPYRGQAQARPKVVAENTAKTKAAAELADRQGAMTGRKQKRVQL